MLLKMHSGGKSFSRCIQGVKAFQDAFRGQKLFKMHSGGKSFSRCIQRGGGEAFQNAFRVGSKGGGGGGGVGSP